MKKLIEKNLSSVRVSLSMIRMNASVYKFWAKTQLNLLHCKKDRHEFSYETLWNSVPLSSKAAEVF